MFIYKIGLCTVIFFLASCSSLADISLTNAKDIGPWLTISGNPSTSIDINWLSKDSEETIVFWGTEREKLREFANEEFKVEKLHSVSLTNLKPGTVYYYSINEEIYQFKTASTTDQEYKITLIGDLQPFKKQSRLSNEIMALSLKREKPHMVVQMGDVSDSGGMNFLQTETLKNITTYASQSPFMATPGNHDYYTGGARNFRNIFPYDYPSETELYHSLTYKNATYIFLDVHIENKTISDEQKEWFEKELQKAADVKNHWIFVLVHDVLLASGSSSMNFDLQKWLVPLVDRFPVDAVFFGHSHNYEHWLYQYGKSGLVYNGEHTPTGKAVHYFCSGGGGAALRVDSLLEREDRVVETQWEDISGKEQFILSANVSKWDSEKYINHYEDTINGTPILRKNYYQLPEKESYSGYNSIYGYKYGEKTLHYINMSFSGDNNTICTISVHYSDGTMLTGPGGIYPQKWILNK